MVCLGWKRIANLLWKGRINDIYACFPIILYRNCMVSWGWSP